MSDITLRSDKPVNGPGLTTAEIDGNFTALNADKMEKSANLSDVTDAAAARDNINVYAKGASLGLILALG